MMFLCAFVVLESIVFLKKMLESIVFLKRTDEEVGAESLAQNDTAWIPTLGAARLNPYHEFMNGLERIVFVFAVLMHLWTVSWAVVDLWTLRVAPWALRILPNYGASITLWLVLFSIGAYAGMALGGLLFFFRAILNGMSRTKAISYLPISVIGVGALILIVYVKANEISLSPFLDVFLLSITITAPLLLEQAVRRLCSHYPALSVNLLLVPKPTRVPPSEATWIFVAFIINLIVCALWYCFRYDPTDTANPNWTGVFG